MNRRANPRYLAVVTLNRLEESEDFLKDLVDSQIQRSSLSSLDQGLYTELVFGTVRMRRSLDYALSRFSSRPLEKNPASRVKRFAHRRLPDFLLRQNPSFGSG